MYTVHYCRINNTGLDNCNISFLCVFSAMSKMNTWHKMRRFYAKQLASRLKALAIRHYHSLATASGEKSQEESTTKTKETEHKSLPDTEGNNSRSAKSSSRCKGDNSRSITDEPKLLMDSGVDNSNNNNLVDASRGSKRLEFSLRELKRCQSIEDLDQLITM